MPSVGKGQTEESDPEGPLRFSLYRSCDNNARLGTVSLKAVDGISSHQVSKVLLDVLSLSANTQLLSEYQCIFVH
jgi:hypothetical protein